MRLVAVHDNEGTISEVLLSPEGVPVSIIQETPPGMTVTEVEPPEELTAVAEQIEIQHLREFMENYRVQTAPQGKASVVRWKP
ncbi:hypothetical protein QFZ63_004205 [Streptomyces sp. B3I7]|nr:hypothetical protein [Streptomyces sp. B3I7]